MNINLPGEPTIVVVRGVDAQYRYTELLRAQHIDCVARVNTDTLIQEHFPDYLRDRETCMKRPGWNGEHSRHLPDLRLRCPVVLARFATQSIIEVSDEEVESIPICTSTEALEAELLHRMKCLATQYYGGPGLYRRADASQDPVPDWEVRPDRGLRLLYDALRRNTDQMDDHHAPIQSLAGIPGRAVTPCVGGTYIDWKSISVYFVQLRYEHQAAGASENHDLFTEVIRQWARSRLEDEHWTDDTDSDLRSNVYDMRRFHRPPNGRRPRRNRKGQVVAMKDLFLSNSGSPSHDTLVRGERDSAGPRRAPTNIAADANGANGNCSRSGSGRTGKEPARCISTCRVTTEYSCGTAKDRACPWSSSGRAFPRSGRNWRNHDRPALPGREDWNSP
ncbi:MAG: hypothetical protein M5U09_04055 [Gammaproteobacteria bacterium]|nr:hypothetical protein [Gammaproteobacteria bacterium]